MNKTFFVFAFPKLQITTTALLRLLKMSTVHACASELKSTCSEMLDGKARAELKLCQEACLHRECPQQSPSPGATGEVKTEWEITGVFNIMREGKKRDKRLQLGNWKSGQLFNTMKDLMSV